MPRAHTPSSERPDTRRLLLLEAAVDVLADEGMASFTHRVIEQRAGVYHGATTHFFGSRDELVDAVFAHLFELDSAVASTAEGVPPDPALARDATEIAVMLRAGARALFGGRREALARYALVVHAAQQPRLQPILARWRTDLIEAVAPYLAALGAEDAMAAARVLVAGADGLLLHALSAPWPRLESEMDRLIDAVVSGAVTL